MPCYKPLSGFRSRTPNSSGKFAVVFRRDLSLGQEVQVPCGRCIGCRLERSRQWAIRCAHEASLHEENSFITLTYNDANLPVDGSLDKRHFQLFMKRLRKRFPGRKIRYYHCGEYGAKLSRPHYHACLFGFDFPDKKFFSEKQGTPLYTSQVLADLWGKGFCTIGDVTFASAAYVARYIMKKVNGKDAEDHYVRIDDVTGEAWKVEPEYTTMSRRPGIAAAWYDEYKSDVFPDDFVVMNGKKMRTPRYYEKRLEAQDPDTFEEVKKKRKEYGKANEEHSTPERLAVREKVKLAQISKLDRKYENDS